MHRVTSWVERLSILEYVVIDVRNCNSYVLFDRKNGGTCLCTLSTLVELCDMGCTIYGLEAEGKRVRRVFACDRDGKERKGSASGFAGNLAELTAVEIRTGVFSKKQSRTRVPDRFSIIRMKGMVYAVDDPTGMRTYVLVVTEDLAYRVTEQGVLTVSPDIVQGLEPVGEIIVPADVQEYLCFHDEYELLAAERDELIAKTKRLNSSLRTVQRSMHKKARMGYDSITHQLDKKWFENSGIINEIVL